MVIDNNPCTGYYGNKHTQQLKLNKIMVHFHKIMCLGLITKYPQSRGYFFCYKLISSSFLRKVCILY